MGGGDVCRVMGVWCGMRLEVGKRNGERKRKEEEEEE